MTNNCFKKNFTEFCSSKLQLIKVNKFACVIYAILQKICGNNILFHLFNPHNSQNTLRQHTISILFKVRNQEVTHSEILKTL